MEQEKIDAKTANTERGRFARLCLEINIDVSFPQSISLDGYVQPILLENSSFCFHCGRIGHDRCHCPKLKNSAFLSDALPESRPWMRIPSKIKVAPVGSRNGSLSQHRNGKVFSNPTHQPKPNWNRKHLQLTSSADSTCSSKMTFDWKQQKSDQVMSVSNSFAPLSHLSDQDSPFPITDKQNHYTPFPPLKISPLMYPQPPRLFRRTCQSQNITISAMDTRALLPHWHLPTKRLLSQKYHLIPLPFPFCPSLRKTPKTSPENLLKP